MLEEYTHAPPIPFFTPTLVYRYRFHHFPMFRFKHDAHLHAPSFSTSSFCSVSVLQSLSATPNLVLAPLFGASFLSLFSMLVPVSKSTITLP